MMEKANLPSERSESACEPNEEAHQPLTVASKENSTMPHPGENKRSKKQNITFAESEKDEALTLSQSSSTAYKDALSQPAAGASHRERLRWLQRRRGVGLWAQCDDCQRWRWLPGTLDRHQLPDRWLCRDNPDGAMASCGAPEAALRVREEEDLIHAEYSCGSLVWARLPGWPWWPAMVDDCPDAEQYYWLDGFSDIPTYYNVVFFDAFDATRAWIAPEALKPFESNKETFKHVQSKKYKKRLEVAMKQANNASNLSPEARLEKYSFIARFKGPIVTPKKISKHVLKMHQKRLERKYHVPFPIESSDDDSEGDSGIQDEPRETKTLKRKNDVCYTDVGTPKGKKPRMRQEKEKKETSRNVIILGTPKGRNRRVGVEKPLKMEAIVDDKSMRMEKKTEENNPVPPVDGSPKGNKSRVESSDGLEHSNAIVTPAETQPCKLRDILEDSINRMEDSLLVVNSVLATESTDAFKEPNSMAVQCGSTKTATALSESPQMEKLTPLTGNVILESHTISEPGTVDDSEYRCTLAPSPSSDDFEF